MGFGFGFGSKPKPKRGRRGRCRNPNPNALTLTLMPSPLALSPFALSPCPLPLPLQDCHDESLVPWWVVNIKGHEQLMTDQLVGKRDSRKRKRLAMQPGVRALFGPSAQPRASRGCPMAHGWPMVGLLARVLESWTVGALKPSRPTDWTKSRD